MSTEKKATRIARGRYNRIAPLYDRMEGFIERSRYRKWRKLLWSKAEGSRILEVEVGTGKNFPFYPPVEMTAVDFSEKMLERAREKAARHGLKVDLRQMDVQRLEFDDDSFDTVAASFVFCSVPDPIRLRPGVTTWLVGEVILYEILGTKVARVRDAESGFTLLEPGVIPGVGADEKSSKELQDESYRHSWEP